MHAVDHLELILNRVQFIAEITLVAKCKQPELQMALTLISELAEIHNQNNGNHDIFKSDRITTTR
ncbi:hypothetical protein SJI19_21905 [Acerihabitans sp. TG2]|uniref:hypothetical protein n=1 Tax=Acerihabitans sp. TG2 TaxID=3096008 RepID=UPI002B22A491|nr:hypothetical protein [Acerihabitans sp. TG2]MEA9393159.1 hypothetical protein [Acerihabitans sp. TG2]